MSKCIFDRPTTNRYHCELHRAWIVRGECHKCKYYREEDMNNQELIRQYNLAIRESRHNDACDILEEILEHRPRVIDPDWKDTIEEFNRRLSKG